MIIITSSLEKIREIKMICPELEVERGPDLQEVMGTKDEVITYKALAAGEGYVVEDTILEIDGQEIVDIRWKLKNLQEGAELKWVVSLGHHTPSGEIRVYRGSVDGVITIPTNIPEGAFGFDMFFKPVGTGKTLHCLRQEGRKNDYSPRAIALRQLVADQPIFCKDVKTIQPWAGDYQTE